MTDPSAAVPAPAEDDEIDLGLLWRALRTRWAVVAGLAALGGLLALLIVLFSRPVFEANGSLYLGDVGSKGSLSSSGGAAESGLSLLFGNVLGGSGIDTQVEILKSRDLLVRAIEASGLNVAVWQGPASAPPSVNFLSWHWHGKRFSQYAPGTQGLEAYNADVTNPSLEKRTLRLQFDQGGHYRVLTTGGHAVLSGQLGTSAVGNGLRLELKAVHAGFVPASGSVYGLRVVRPRHLLQDLSKELSIQAASGASQAQQTLVVNLDYKNHDPYQVRRFLADLMQAYLAQNHRWSTEQASEAYAYLNGQLKKIRQSLEHADQRLADYQKRSGVISVSADAKAMIGQLAQYETQRAAAELKLYNLRAIEASLQAPGGHIDRYLLSSIDNKVLDGLSLQLVQAQNKLATLFPEYTDQAPQVIEVHQTINRIRASILNLIRNKTHLASREVSDMNALIGRFKTRLKKLPEAELEVVALTRSSDVLGKLYMFMLQKQEEAALQKAGTVTNNRVLDHAETAGKPVSPVARTDLVLGVFLGAFLGLVWVLGAALLTPGFRSEEELRRAYPNLNTFALLPYSKSIEEPVQFKPADPRSGFGEAIRLLRANLYLSQRAGEDKLWMVTSTAPGDGKSTVSYELATAFAADGKRVLLMDADIRKPHAHERLSASQSPGLTDLLAGRNEAGECVRNVEPLGFDLLPAGRVPPNPTELINSPRLPDLLKEFEAQYDYVLLDTPPFPLVSDALTIAKHVPRVLSVVRLGKTPRSTFAEHVRKLPPSGLIINDLRGGSGYGYHDSYGYGVAQTDTGWRRWIRPGRRG